MRVSKKMVAVIASAGLVMGSVPAVAYAQDGSSLLDLELGTDLGGLLGLNLGLFVGSSGGEAPEALGSLESFGDAGSSGAGDSGSTSGSADGSSGSADGSAGGDSGSQITADSLGSSEPVPPVETPSGEFDEELSLALGSLAVTAAAIAAATSNIALPPLPPLPPLGGIPELPSLPELPPLPEFRAPSVCDLPEQYIRDLQNVGSADANECDLPDN